MCFNNEVRSLTRLKVSIYNSAETIKKGFQTAVITAGSDRWISWNSINFNCHILNVDGSRLGTPTRAGYGGLIRNSVGLFLKGFSGLIHGSTCILQVDLTAILEGFRMVVIMGIEELVCFSDSQILVNLVSGEVSKFHAYTVIIQDIKDIIASHNFRIFHTLREGNRCANFLAKIGATSTAPFLEHQSPPLDLIGMLKIDASGTCFLRT